MCVGGDEDSQREKGGGGRGKTNKPNRKDEEISGCLQEAGLKGLQRM